MIKRGRGLSDGYFYRAALKTNWSRKREKFVARASQKIRSYGIENIGDLAVKISFNRGNLTHLTSSQNGEGTLETKQLLLKSC